MPTNGRVKILGVPVDTLTQAQILERLSGWIAAGLPNQVVTVNPEFLVAAQYDRPFKQALNEAGLSVSDGIGIRAAATYQKLWAPSWQPARTAVTLIQGVYTGLAILLGRQLLTTPIPETITGVDLVHTLARAASEHAWRMYLVGGDPDRAQQTKSALLAMYPGLKIVGAEEGIPKPERRAHDHATYEQALIERVRTARPDILFVAFGAPTQDRFIAEHKTELGVPVMMGVGGAFDFITGVVRRAPSWLRSLGLEWLWRFMIQPWRWRRILTATIIFPLHVFLERQRHSS